jgi:site-specific recombinase XerD
MITKFYSDPEIVHRLRFGPLGPHIDAFARMLFEQGYSCPAAKQKIHLIAELSLWLNGRHLALSSLNEKTIDRFKQDRRRLHRGESAALRQIIQFLRRTDVIKTPRTKSKEPALERITEAFARYLAAERGLQSVTVVNYIRETRLFLRERYGHGPVLLKRICPKDITGFVLRRADAVSPRRAQLTVSALRSFFRFLLHRGKIRTDLAAVIPTVANWRLAVPPKFIEAADVERLLQSCDRNSAIGRRDHAVLLLLARLGLRAGEVDKMMLEDIDWDAGELLVRGKGGRQDCLPIPKDVGDALARYLRQDRPCCSSRRVFIRMNAPHQGFSSSVAVDNIVRRALTRAGLHPSLKGAHLLRHSLATKMLRHGASLPEIGQILRHTRVNTTEIYAKVDFASLSTLALPWPGGAK